MSLYRAILAPLFRSFASVCTNIAIVIVGVTTSLLLVAYCLSTYQIERQALPLFAAPPLGLVERLPLVLRADIADMETEVPAIRLPDASPSDLTLLRFCYRVGFQSTFRDFIATTVSAATKVEMTRVYGTDWLDLLIDDVLAECDRLIVACAREAVAAHPECCEELVAMFEAMVRSRKPAFDRAAMIAVDRFLR